MAARIDGMNGAHRGGLRLERCSWALLVSVVVMPAWALGRAAADDWPQWRGLQRDGMWRETGILEAFPKGGPKIRWRTPIGAGYSGPAVAHGRVYVLDRGLRPHTPNPSNPFSRSEVPGTERVLCLDERSGQVLWRYEYDCPYRISYASGPRATPTVAGGKVYTLGAMGHLICFDAASGKVLWSRDLARDYAARVPVWGMASSPLVDGNQLICLVGGARDAAVVSFHTDTGKELWRSLKTPSEIGYCSPIIIRGGGVRQLIIWIPGMLASLNPRTGTKYWSEPFFARFNMTIATPATEGNLLLISTFYTGPLMVRLAEDCPAATVLWRGRSESEFRTDKLHCLMSPPVIRDGYVYGIDSYGELRCLEAQTGKRLWQTYAATRHERWSNAFLVPNGDRFFLFNEDGDLIIARLMPQGYSEVSRAHVIDPTNTDVANMRGRPQETGRPWGMRRLVVWSHPAFANKSIYARNDREIICVSLAAETPAGAKEKSDTALDAPESSQLRFFNTHHSTLLSRAGR